MEIVYALAGVATGWVLNNINTYYSNRVLKKKFLGKQIQRMFWIRQKFLTWNSQMYIFKDQLSDFRKFEARRKVMHSVSLFDYMGLDEDIIAELSEFDPILSIEIKQQVEAFKSSHGMIEKAFETSDMTGNEFVYYTTYFGSLIDALSLQAKLEKTIVTLGKAYGYRIGFKLRRRIIETRDNQRPLAFYINDHISKLQSEGRDTFNMDTVVRAMFTKIDSTEENKKEFLGHVLKTISKQS